jgi:subtilisin-like proprotein convertase family protein
MQQYRTMVSIAVGVLSGLGATSRAEVPAALARPEGATSSLRAGRTPMLAGIVLEQMRARAAAQQASGAPTPAMCFVPNPTPEEWAQISGQFGGLPVGQVKSGLRFFSDTPWVNDGAIGTVGQARQARLTMSFPADGTTWGASPTGPNRLRQDLVAIFGEGNTDQGYELIRQAFASWRRVSSLTFTQVADNNSSLSTSSTRQAARGDIRVGAITQGTNGTLAYNFYPTGGGDMTINSSYMNPGSSMGGSSNTYRYLRNVVAHELGHGLGYAHPVPCNNTKLMEPFINLNFEMVQIDEIRGAQRNYGDRFAGNTSSALARDFGSLTTPALTGVRERNLSTNGTAGANGSDEDWFRFALGSAQTVRVAIQQTGGSYANQQQTTDCNGAANPAPVINAGNAGTLSLRLLTGTSTPTSTLLTVDATLNAATGLLEAVIPSAALGAGNYWVQVIDLGPNDAANQFVQLYDLEIRPAGATAPPLAVAGVNVKRCRTGEACWFMGDLNSRAQEHSPDVNGTPIALSGYEWDLDGNGTFETVGAQVRRVYTTAGTVNVTLRVTDANGRQATDTVQVVVTGSGSIASVTGATPGAGSVAVPIVINGTNLFGLTSASQVVVSGAGVTASGTPVVNGTGTQVTGLSLQADALAAIGTRDLALTGMDAASGGATSFIAIGAVTVVAVPPVNDACAAAIPLAPFVSGVSTTEGTARFATVDGASSCQSTTGAGVDVYYTLSNPTARSYRLATCSTATAWDTMISVHTACPASGANTVSGGCINQGCGSGNLSSLTLASLAPGNFVVRVAGWSPTVTGAAFTLVVTDLGPPAGLPANDECAGAIVVTAPSLTAFSTVSSTSSLIAAPSCGAVNNDLWYAFTPTLSGTLRVTPMQANSRTAIYTGACGTLTQVACATAGAWAQASVTPGTTYLIRTGSTLTTGRADTLSVTFAPSAAGSCCVDGVCTIVDSGACAGAFVAGGACFPASGSVLTFAGTGGAIPDQPSSGPNTALVRTIAVSDPATVAGVEVTLDVSHANLGDLVVSLFNGSRRIDLINRVGRSGTSLTGRSSDLTGGGTGYTFSDLGAQLLNQATTTNPSAAPQGTYLASGVGDQPLSLTGAFNGAPAMGTWTLVVSDYSTGTAGTLNGWTLRLRTAAPSDCQPLRACCLADGSCQVVSQSACAGLGGSWSAGATACAQVSCQVLTGACCLSDGSCLSVVQASCPGEFQGAGMACTPATCPQPVACCLPSGSCVVSLPAACAADGGTLQAAGACAGVSCPQPLGACCLASGACVSLDSASCTLNGGSFQGVGSACATANCPQPVGACCLPSGTCGLTSEAECGGTFQGVGSACASVNCPQPQGACCLTDGSCVSVPQASCAGVFQGAGVACASVNCPQPPGACCLADGSCVSVPQASCAGVFQGVGTACASVACDQPGVCCRGTTCSTLVQSACDALGPGTFSRFVTMASPACNPAGVAVSPCCYADFNKNQTVNIDDIFIFLNAWFDSSPYTRVGGDGVSGPSIDDIFKYLNAWFAGCS